MLDLFPSRTAGPFGRRQRHARGGRVPVTVVTGFLGAGKTTLVRRFLGSPEGHGTAVIVNEFGSVGIDDALLRSSTDETVLLGNGCLCCSTRSDLQVALHRLIADRERGVLPPFQRVLIETSGLADPGPILQTFATDRALRGECHLELVLSVVDAVSGEATLEWSAEARRQVILADRLIVSKSDLAEEVVLKRLIGRLRELNPRAAIETAVEGDVDPRHLIEAPPESGLPPSAQPEFFAEAVHSDDIASFVLAIDEPIQWPVFARFMETLIGLRGPDLLRAKGFVNVVGCTGPVLVQFVQHLAPPPIELDRWPEDDRTSRVVFITRNIPEAAVRTLFHAVGALGAKEPATF